MARGNQRDKAREANQKKLAAEASSPVLVLTYRSSADTIAPVEEGQQYVW